MSVKMLGVDRGTMDLRPLPGWIAKLPSRNACIVRAYILSLWVSDGTRVAILGQLAKYLTFDEFISLREEILARQ